MAIYRLLLNKDPRATLAGKFCGSSFPKSMRIAESSFTVQFVSDSGHETSNSYTGFSLYYEAYIKDSESNNYLCVQHFIPEPYPLKLTKP